MGLFEEDEEGRPVYLHEAVFRALGAASTCWDKLSQAGVFESERAKGIGEEFAAWIEDRYVPKLPKDFRSDVEAVVVACNRYQTAMMYADLHPEYPYNDAELEYCEDWILEFARILVKKKAD